MVVSDRGKYRLLVVEDDKDCSDLIVRTALKCGYESISVHDAHILPEVISNWRPHVVTLDHCLPNNEGFEAIAALGSAQFMGDLVIVSGQPAWLRKEAVRSASTSGLRVTADLGKPVEIAELRDLLTTLRAGLSASLPGQADSNLFNSQQRAYETRNEPLATAIEKKRDKGRTPANDRAFRPELGGGLFSLTDGSELPPLKLLQLYRQLAEDARGEAARSKHAALRDSYLLTAEQWERLAADLTMNVQTTPK